MITPHSSTVQHCKALFMQHPHTKHTTENTAPKQPPQNNTRYAPTTRLRFHADTRTKRTSVGPGGGLGDGLASVERAVCRSRRGTAAPKAQPPPAAAAAAAGTCRGDIPSPAAVRETPVWPDKAESARFDGVGGVLVWSMAPGAAVRVRTSGSPLMAPPSVSVGKRRRVGRGLKLNGI